MPQQEAIAIRHPFFKLGPFMDVDVAASQTDAQLLICGTGPDSEVMPVGGSVVGIAYTLSAAGTTGAFTIGVTINGTENTTTTQTVGTTTEGYARFAEGAIPFAAGANIGVEITTAAGWDGTTSDLAVYVYVLLTNFEV